MILSDSSLAVEYQSRMLLTLTESLQLNCTVDTTLLPKTVALVHVSDSYTTGVTVVGRPCQVVAKWVAWWHSIPAGITESVEPRHLLILITRRSGKA